MGQVEHCMSFKVTFYVAYLENDCLSCVTSMKSAFSKPGFPANNGTFSSYERKEISPMRWAGREWGKWHLVQRSTERWLRRTVGARGLPPCLPQYRPHNWHLLGS